jgi:hypothetical protein
MTIPEYNIVIGICAAAIAVLAFDDELSKKKWLSIFKKYKLLIFIVATCVGVWASVKKDSTTDLNNSKENTKTAYKIIDSLRQYIDTVKISLNEESKKNKQLGDTLERLVINTNELTSGLITGGSSFLYGSLSPMSNENSLLKITNMGKFPMYDVSLRVEDIDLFNFDYDEIHEKIMKKNHKVDSVKKIIEKDKRLTKEQKYLIESEAEIEFDVDNQFNSMSRDKRKKIWDSTDASWLKRINKFKELSQFQSYVGNLGIGQVEYVNIPIELLQGNERNIKIHFICRNSSFTQWIKIRRTPDLKSVSKIVRDADNKIVYQSPVPDGFLKKGENNIPWTDQFYQTEEYKKEQKANMASMSDFWDTKPSAKKKPK